MSYCLIYGVGDGRYRLWGMSILPHMILGYRFYAGVWWDMIFCGSHLVCKIWTHRNCLDFMWLQCGLYDHCRDLQRDVDFCIDMMRSVISFGLWYLYHGVLLFGDGDLICGVCSLVLLVHAAHLCFCYKFDVTAYSWWHEDWSPMEVASIYGFAQCGDEGVSHSGMVILN